MVKNTQMPPPDWNDGLHGTVDENGKAAFQLREVNGAIFMENLRRTGGITDDQHKAYAWAMTWPTVSYRPWIYKAALPVLAAGFELPELKVETFGKRESSLAYYSYHLSGKHAPYISFNTNEEKRFGDMLSDYPYHPCVMNGWWTQANTALHELGHAIADQASGHLGCRYGRSAALKKFSARSGAIRAGSKMRKFIERNVSRYGATRWSEFDAELIAGILSGKKYPKQVIDLLPDFPDERFIRLKQKGTEEA